MVPVVMNYDMPGNKCNPHTVKHKQNSGSSGLISSLRHFVCVLLCPFVRTVLRFESPPSACC